MARWTTSEQENEHVRTLFEQVMTSIGPGEQTLIMKDGRRLTGKVLPGKISNNKGQGVPERCAAAITLRNAGQDVELDALDVEQVIGGPLN